MDFDPSEEQEVVLRAMDALLVRHAGPARAIALQAAGAYDHSLERALGEAGYLEIGRELGRLEAVLLVESVSRHAGTAAVAARTLAIDLAPDAADWAGPLAIVDAQHAGPVRYGAVARTLLVDAGEEARVVAVSDGEVEPRALEFRFSDGPVVRGVAARRRGPGSRQRSPAARGVATRSRRPKPWVPWTRRSRTRWNI